jgi:hypothetical protein
MNPSRVSQRANSYKSGLRAIPGAKDAGQRFVVHYRDGVGEKRIYGFTNDVAERDRFIGAIRKHPVWKKPTFVDRQKVTP